MVIDDLYNFDKLVEACGNRYLAVMFLSESARKLGKIKKEYHLFESKLLQWVLTGQCPYTEIQLESMKERHNSEGLDAILCWVADKQVSDEVRFLYKKSIKNRRITYSTNENLSTSKCDRANILLRMVWYSSTI